MDMHHKDAMSTVPELAGGAPCTPDEWLSSRRIVMVRQLSGKPLKYLFTVSSSESLPSSARSMEWPGAATKTLHLMNCCANAKRPQPQPDKLA